MSETSNAHTGTRNRPTRRDMFYVGFEFLQVVENFNVRKDYGDLEALASSIQENGVKVPLRGYKKGDNYFVTDGHRRYAALKLLKERGLEIQAPFVVETKDYNEEKRVLDMLITNEGKALLPIEEAEVYSRLIAYGWSKQKIATKASKSISHIDNMLLLSSAPKSLKNEVVDKKITSSDAVKLLRSKRDVNDTEARKEVLKRKPTLKHLKEVIAEFDIDDSSVNAVVSFLEGELDKDDFHNRIISRES